MQIDEATKQATAPDTEGGGRISPPPELGAEVGTAADGQTKAEGLRQTPRRKSSWGWTPWLNEATSGKRMSG